MSFSVQTQYWIFLKRPKATGSKMSLYEEREVEDIHHQNERAASPEPSCVSMRSARSMPEPPKFSDELVTFNPR